MPIKAMNTFTKDWIIKARISSKGEMKTTKKGGQLLKIELVDSFGTKIEGTFFNDDAKHFDPLMQEDKVYLFSNGNVKMANKRFTSLTNDFCIIFEKHAGIQEVKDDGSIAKQAFEFKKIATIEEAVQIKSIDIMGVVCEVREKEEIKLKSGVSKVRKYITLADQSMCSISLTLWGNEMCTRMDGLRVGQILAVKSARISDFGGKSLNAADDHASLFAEIDHPDTDKLRQWYNSHSTEDFNNLRCLTQKPQSRNDMMAANMGSNDDKNGKSSNLNVSKSPSNS